MITLRGTTWAHTRGFAPLAAGGRVYEDFHPDVRVLWDHRSLWSFGEEPLDDYLDRYDLLVFDFPFTGMARERGWFLPIDEALPAAIVDERRRATVGPTFASFTLGGRQWALPVDASCQVAASRPDLMAVLGEAVPRRWSDVLALARRTSRVAMPLKSMGAWGAMLTLAANQGDTPLHRDDGRAFDPEIAAASLSALLDLLTVIDRSCLAMNPVQVLSAMAIGRTIAYVPLTYGYCTYGLEGYAPHRLSFHDLPKLNPARGGAALGGAGLAISSRSKHPREAAAFVDWVTSPRFQRSFYVAAGGQPSHRVAWQDPAADALTAGFFSGTLPTVEAAYLRPNAIGFSTFQTAAGEAVHALLSDGGNVRDTVTQIESHYVNWRGTR